MIARLLLAIARVLRASHCVSCASRWNTKRRALVGVSVDRAGEEPAPWERKS